MLAPAGGGHVPPNELHGKEDPMTRYAKFRLTCAVLAGIGWASTVHGIWLQLAVGIVSAAGSLAVVALYDGWLADD